MKTADAPRDRLVHELRRTQADGWRAGARPPLEALLASRPELQSDPESLLELLCAELLLRSELGETPAADDYVERFPSLAAEIERQIVVHSLFDSLATDSAATLLGSSVSSHDPSSFDAPDRLPDIPGYEVERVLGQGGMAIVYLAKHRELGHQVAIKRIRDTGPANDSFRDRLRREARAIALLRHPQIVQVYDYVEYHGAPYVVLEYVTGGGLDSRLAGQRFPLDETVDFMTLVAQAAGFAHEHQFVHRDLKPANLLLAQRSPHDAPRASGLDDSTSTPDGSFRLADYAPKIADFGLAKSLVENQQLTHSEAFLGTGAYMAPEQAWGRARDVGPATDVHAIGLLLYELLTGAAPYRAPTFVETLDRIRFHAPVPPRELRPEIPTSLEAICLRCLAKDPAERYQNGNELADDLRRFRANEPVRAAVSAPRRPRSEWMNRLAFVAAICLVAVALIYGLIQGTRPTDSDGTVSAAGDRTNADKAGVSPVSPPRTIGERFAFLVGVRSYRFPDGSLDLEFTENDVDELSRALLRSGVPRQNIRLMTQWSEADNPELAPTAANVRTQLRQVLARCIPDDTLLVAVTGMGGDLGRNGAYCYLPADARPDQRDSLIALGEFYELLAACPARSKLLLVDTCQSAVGINFDWPDAGAPPPGVAVLFACSSQEGSYEHERLRHGVFSYHVLRAIEGAADTDHDRRITLEELSRYTQEHVPPFVREQFPGRTQTPRLLSNLSGSTVLLERQ